MKNWLYSLCSTIYPWNLYLIVCIRNPLPLRSAPFPLPTDNPSLVRCVYICFSLLLSSACCVFNCGAFTCKVTKIWAKVRPALLDFITAVRLCWTCLCPVPTASAQGNFTEDGMGGESAGLPAPQKTRQSQGGGRQVRGGWGAQGRQRDRETRLKAKKKGRIWDLESCICRNFSSSRKYLRVFFFNVSRLF